MKILDFLKKPLYSYNSRSTQKKFILECEIENGADYNNTIDLPKQQASNSTILNEFTLKKKLLVLTKPSKRFISDLMPKKLRSSDSMKSRHSTGSSNESKSELEEESYNKTVCFDNYAYGSMSTSDVNLDMDEIAAMEQA